MFGQNTNLNFYLKAYKCKINTELILDIRNKAQ